ncbi:hypothetical protein [Kutzneria albida]|uniref:Extracellular repeat protein, HAF family n=1 Tax=Kutzneria albida DSM 43870 TaxID=1449976 RepID=W5WG26_9PSEU|nr:hypothetical protein [Kutzneria albida]AHH99690.1 hypothetical protein KALB_6330 [Kutzneria albida DSM 43870]
MRRSLLITALLAGAMTCPVQAHAAAACTWQGTALSLPNSQNGSVTATNGAGTLAGYGVLTTVPTSVTHLVAWRNGAYTDYGKPDAGYASSPQAIDKSGTVVGTSRFSYMAYLSKAIRAVPGKKVEFLPQFQDYAYASANQIADNGDIYGWASKRTAEPTIGLRWPADKPGTVEQVPGVANPVAIDHDGAALTSTAVVRGGVSKKLGTLPGLTGIDPQDISNGRVVGVGDYNGKPVGLYWDQQLAVHVLPNSSYSTYTGYSGFAINRNGLITGRVDEAHGGNDHDGTGYGVWNQGAFVSTFGDLKHDYPGVVGEDGVVGGARYDDNRKAHPYSWRCG